MAKPKGTGTSSYERINLALCATSEFREYEDTFKKLVKSIRIVGLSYEEFSLSTNPDGMPDHRFEVAVGDKRIEAFRFKDVESVRVSVDPIVTAESLVVVLEQFGEGRKVRTFNCRKDQVSTRFLAHARSILSSKNENLLEEARRRLVAQAQNMADSGQVREGRLGAYENEAVDQIRSVLLKFRNIRREALKRAIDEFIVHDVTTS